MSSPAIEIRGLRKVYGDTVAVDGLDLVVPRGSTYALLGPNGSGKTTTIRTLLRIQEPDAGTVRVLGEEPGPEVRDRIGYLPEERGLYPRMKVRDVLTFLAELKGIPPKVSRPRIDGWLERVGLAERAETQVQG
ncbi:MAG: ABC transporter ATP-binding protein, partial [Gemmatimonadota bacterium]